MKVLLVEAGLYKRESPDARVEKTFKKQRRRLCRYPTIDNPQLGQVVGHLHPETFHNMANCLLAYLIPFVNQ